MIKYASILLLAIMLTQTLGKGLVWLNHQINKEYISQNLCEKKKANCEGKCHLKKQLDKTESDADLSDFLKLKIEVYIPASVSIQFPVCKVFIREVNSDLPPYSDRFSSESIRAIFHPPTSFKA